MRGPTFGGAPLPLFLVDWVVVLTQVLFAGLAVCSALSFRARPRSAFLLEAVALGAVPKATLEACDDEARAAHWQAVACEELRLGLFRLVNWTLVVFATGCGVVTGLALILALLPAAPYDLFVFRLLASVAVGVSLAFALLAEPTFVPSSQVGVIARLTRWL